MSGDANKACSSKQAPGRMKPPHSYIALIATAILSSPEKRLTLTEINEHLVNNYSFFRGSYQGWRNSVRHNLSFNKCFVKILRDPARPWGKDNYWTVCSLTDYLLSDGTFRRRRRRKPKKKAEAKDAEQMQHGVLERSSNEHKPKLLKTSVHPNRPGSSGADTAHCSRVESRPERTPFKGSFSIDRILSDENWNEKKPELSLQPSASHLDIPGLAVPSCHCSRFHFCHGSSLPAISNYTVPDYSAAWSSLGYTSDFCRYRQAPPGQPSRKSGCCFSH